MTSAILPPPLSSRQQIPFYHPKSEAEFRRDPYERYETMVMRQSQLHFGYGPADTKPFQMLHDWFENQLPLAEETIIAEIGCGLAASLGKLAHRYPKLQAYGIDFSYQMLKWAHNYWLAGKSIEIDWSERGFPPQSIRGYHLDNLYLGLAKAEVLPFPTASIDHLYSSFLLDRVESPEQALSEMYRVLKPGGSLLLVSPLNFQNAIHWKHWASEGQIQAFLHHLGMIEVQCFPSLLLREPLDTNGNVIAWQCHRFRAVKA